MEYGCDFHELTDYKELLKGKLKSFPNECKKFIKNECKKLKQKTKSFANSEVGKSDKSHKHYVDGFKDGKPFDNGDTFCCRVYNNTPHAHLIENGHKIVRNNSQIGFVSGKYIMQKSGDNFQDEFVKNTEDFLLGDYENDRKK